MESTQSCAPLQKSTLPSPMNVQDSSQNQVSTQPIANHLQNQNLQSMQPGTLCTPGQLPPTDGQLCIQNQEHLQTNSMYGVAQHPHNQATLSAPEGVSSSDADVLPVSEVTEQQNHQHNQENLPPESPPRTFPDILAEFLRSANIPGLSTINQEENPSSQMGAAQQSSELNLDQIMEAVMRQYSNALRRKREMLGFSQMDVAVELTHTYEEKVLEAQMSVFETSRMSMKKMCKLKLLLDNWLASIEASLRIYQSLNPTDYTPNIVNPTTARHVLEKAFLQNPNPASEEIEKLAKDLTLDTESVTIWFFTRSEVLNRIQSLTACTMESDPERIKDEEQLKNFARTFKQRKKELGFTYDDFCKVVSKLQSKPIKPGTLTRFENCEMTSKNMRKLKPILQKCLKEMEDSSNFSRPSSSSVTSPSVSVSPIFNHDYSTTRSTILQHISTPKDNDG